MGFGLRSRAHFVPPNRRDDSARAVGNNVPSVANRIRNDSRTDDFEQHAPDRQMESDLGWIRHGVVSAEPQPALKEQHGRQRAGNQQQVVELGTQEGAVKMGLQAESVERIERATHREQRITPIEKPHSNDRMIMPKMTAKANLKINVIP